MGLLGVKGSRLLIFMRLLKRCGILKRRCDEHYVFMHLTITTILRCNEYS